MESNYPSLVRLSVTLVHCEVRGVREAEGDAQQLRNRLERIEGDIRRCLDGLQCLKGPGLGVGNPGTHLVTHPDANKGKPETDGQTDGQTDRTAVSNSAVYRRALKIST